MTNKQLDQSNLGLSGDAERHLRHLARDQVERILLLLRELPPGVPESRVLSASHVRVILGRDSAILRSPEIAEIHVATWDMPTSAARDIAASLGRVQTAVLGAQCTSDGIVAARTRGRDDVTAERLRLSAGRLLGRAAARRTAADIIHGVLGIFDELPVHKQHFRQVLDSMCARSGIVITDGGYAVLDPRGRPVKAEDLGPAFAPAALQAKAAANAADFRTWYVQWLALVWEAIDDGTGGAAAPVLPGPSGPDVKVARLARAIDAQREADARDTEEVIEMERARVRSRLLRQREERERARREEARRHRIAMGYGTLDTRTEDGHEKEVGDGGLSL